MTTEVRQAPISPGTIAGPYGQHLIKTALDLGVAKEQLSACVDFDIEATPSSISATDYLSLLATAEKQIPNIGIEVGKRVTPGSYPTLGLTLLSCETLEQTLEQVILFESLVHDLGTTTLSSGTDTIELTWQPNEQYFPDIQTNLCRSMVESVFAGIKVFAEWLTGSPLNPLQVEVSYPKPNYSTLEDESQCPVIYAANNNRIIAEVSLLKRPVIAGDSTLYPVVRAHAENLKSSQQKQSISLQVKRFLVTHINQKDLSIEAAANACCVSVRTLQRKLKDENTGYQALLDEVRYQLALHYLTTTQLSLEQIADAIGFQEATSFYHAFKNWSGLTPTEYRERH